MFNTLKIGLSDASESKRPRRTRKVRTESEMSLCSNGSEDSVCSTTPGNENSLQNNLPKDLQTPSYRGTFLRISIVFKGFELLSENTKKNYRKIHLKIDTTF